MRPHPGLAGVCGSEQRTAQKRNSRKERPAEGTGRGLLRRVPTRPTCSSPDPPHPAGLREPAAPHLTPARAALGAGPASRFPRRPGAPPTGPRRLRLARSPLSPRSPLAPAPGAISFSEGGTSGWAAAGEAPAGRKERPSITKERAPPPAASAERRVRGTLAPPPAAPSRRRRRLPWSRPPGAAARSAPGRPHTPLF